MSNKILKASFIVIKILISIAVGYEIIYIFIHDLLLIEKFDLFIFFSMLIPVLVIYFVVISAQIEDICESGHYFCHTDPDTSKCIFEIIINTTSLVIMNLFIAFLFFESVQSNSSSNTGWSYNYLLLFFNFIFPFFTIQFQGVEKRLTSKIKKSNRHSAELLLYNLAIGKYKLDKSGFSLDEKRILRESGHNIEQLEEQYCNTSNK
jgi:hypothetical protein